MKKHEVAGILLILVSGAFCMAIDLIFPEANLSSTIWVIGTLFGFLAGTIGTK
jgi:hypothetical protein